MNHATPTALAALVFTVALSGCETTLPPGLKSIATFIETDSEVGAIKRSLIGERYSQAARQIVDLAQVPGGIGRVAAALDSQPAAALDGLAEALDTLQIQRGVPTRGHQDLRALQALATGPFPRASSAAANYRASILSSARDGLFYIGADPAIDFQRELALSDDEYIDVLVDYIVAAGGNSEVLVGSLTRFRAAPTFPAALAKLGARLDARKWSAEELKSMRDLDVPGVEAKLARLEQVARERAEAAAARKRPVGPEYAGFVRRAKDSITRDLRDPESVRFRDLFLSRHGSVTFLCGELNGKNAYGAYIGYVRFYTDADGALKTRESQDSRWSFEPMWAKFCADQFGTVPGPADRVLR